MFYYELHRNYSVYPPNLNMNRICTLDCCGCFYSPNKKVKLWIDFLSYKNETLGRIVGFQSSWPVRPIRLGSATRVFPKILTCVKMCRDLHVSVGATIYSSEKKTFKSHSTHDFHFAAFQMGSHWNFSNRLGWLDGNSGICLSLPRQCLFPCLTFIFLLT